MKRNTRRNTAAIMAALLLAASGCNQSTTTGGGTVSGGGSTGGKSIVEPTVSLTSPLVANVDAFDQETGWDSTATEIQLEGQSATISGSGASAQGGTITITAAGTYVVSGTMSNGQIAIAATSQDKVHLVLNGAQITNSTGAAIYASQCDKLVITLAANTENTLTDGGAGYQYADEANQEPNAALFCKDDLTINGTGQLVVNAGFNNGIGTKDDLLILGGNIQVDAANHGLRGNDSVTLLDGLLKIDAGNDGVQSSNADEADKGWILLEGGSVQINAAQDGIQAETALAITGGELTIETAGGAVASAPEITADTSSDSYKGVKAGGDLYIGGGEILVNSYDDCIHSNANVTISGGDLELSTSDDGVHADGDLTITDGTIQVLTCYEGLEGYNLFISGGTIHVKSSDDGLNASGGQADPGGNSATASCALNISGGTVSIFSSDDGIDSNGTLNISGGTVIAMTDAAGGQGGTGALDSDGKLNITGGIVISGGTATGDVPGTSSSQSYVYSASSIKAGSQVSLQKDGATLASFVPQIDCTVVQISTPEVTAGESYTLYSDESSLATITAGEGGGSLMGGGGRMKGAGGMGRGNGAAPGQPPANAPAQ